MFISNLKLKTINYAVRETFWGNKQRNKTPTKQRKKRKPNQNGTKQNTNTTHQNSEMFSHI